jgi:hypothetical protein
LEQEHYLLEHIKLVQLYLQWLQEAVVLVQAAQVLMAVWVEQDIQLKMA